MCSPIMNVHSTLGLRTKPPHLEPVLEDEQAVLDIRGMTISWSKLKTLGYQVTLFMDSEIRKMLRCSDCLRMFDFTSHCIIRLIKITSASQVQGPAVPGVAPLGCF